MLWRRTSWRADDLPIYERGIITIPDLVAVADDSLVPVPAAGMLSGVGKHTTLLIGSDLEASLILFRSDSRFASGSYETHLAAQNGLAVYDELSA